MANELIVQDNPWFALVQDQLNKGTSVQDLKDLMGIAERHRAIMAEQAWIEAMMHCQEEMPPLVKSGHNTHKDIRYAKFETLDKQIRPVYLKYKMALGFTEIEQSNADICRMALDVTHVQGWSKRFQKDVHVDGVGQKGNANMTATQADGSTASYARRYVTKLAFNLVEAGEDLDGDVAKLGPITKEEAKLLRAAIAETAFVTSRPLDIGAVLRFADPKLKKIEEMNREQYMRVMNDLGFQRQKVQEAQKKGGN